MYGNGYYSPYYPQGYAGYMPQNGAMPDQLAQLRGAGQQAQPQPQQQAAGNGTAMIWVQGEAGAKSYLVAPGNTVMLMDSEANVFYIKSADASGMPMPLRTFDYRERVAEGVKTVQATAAETFDPNRYITREEFEEFRALMCGKGTEDMKDGE